MQTLEEEISSFGQHQSERVAAAKAKLKDCKAAQAAAKKELKAKQAARASAAAQAEAAGTERAALNMQLAATKASVQGTTSKFSEQKGT